MNAVQYYEYDVQRPIARIEKRLAEFLAGSVETQDELAAFLLETYVNSIPESLAQLSKVSLTNRDTANAAWLNEQLQAVAAESGHWVEIPNDAAIDAYFQSLHDIDTINTTQLLGLIHYSLTRRSGFEIPDVIENYARRLLGKFEIFGRVFTRYDPDFRKVGEDFDSLINYSLLSLVLLALYDKSQKLEFLNTALKLNDLICTVDDRYESAPEMATAYAALCEGASLVEKLYARREFRLPADQ